MDKDLTELSQVKGKWSHTCEDPTLQRIPNEIIESIKTQAKNHIAPTQIRLNLANTFPGQYIGSKRQIKYISSHSERIFSN